MGYPIYYVEENDTLPIFFDTFDGGTGASITMTGLAVTDIEIYKDGSVTQRASDAGYTLLDTDGIDFDGITGIHGFSLDLSDNTDAGFYSVGSWYHVVVSSVTVDAQTVNFVAAAFRIVSATRGMAGTALPNAAAEAAGGLYTRGTGAGQINQAANGQVDTNTVAISADSVAADNAESFFDGTGYAGTNNVIPTVTTLTGHTAQSGDSFARLGLPAGASVSADIAAVKTDTTEILIDTGTTIPASLPAALTKGFADSGTTTTMVDAALTEADTDYWKGCLIRFTSGTISGQTRLITGFTPASDTVTFAPATTQAVGTNTYEILPAGAVNVGQWNGTNVPAEHTAGCPIVTVKDGTGTGEIDTASGTVSLSAATQSSIVDNVWDRARSSHTTPGTFGEGCASVQGNVTGSIGSLGATAKTDVNTEVADVLKTDTVTLPGQTAPPASPTMEQALGWLYKLMRNKKTQTSSQWSLYDDAGTTVDSKATVSDDTTTATKEEIVSGP